MKAGWRSWTLLAASLVLPGCQSPLLPRDAVPDPRSAAIVTQVPEQATRPVPTPTPEANIVITVPAPGATVGSPVRISGSARVFEATVVILVYDSQSKELVRQPAQASIGGPAWGSFQKDVTFSAPDETGPGRIEVVSFSPKDGSVSERASVPVTLQARASPAAGDAAASSPR